MGNVPLCEKETQNFKILSGILYMCPSTLALRLMNHPSSAVLLLKNKEPFDLSDPR